MVINRKCFVCGVDMIERETSINAGWGKYKVTIEGVKSHECPRCGEKIFSSEEVNMIENLGKSLAALQDANKPDLLNVSETADLLRVSNQTVYNMIKDGRLRATKIGREWRFLRQDIESVMSKNDFYVL
ncbi:MAG: helix-turn-helix domain-containing protein [Clostridia bacterium]|jgi:excisionase family DNA binding protein/YgiT-type zinc finger domain-containing protein